VWCLGERDETRALIACLLATPAVSAESPQSDEMDTVVVTGSRIAVRPMNTPRR
jgi:hypothetical protein